MRKLRCLAEAAELCVERRFELLLRTSGLLSRSNKFMYHRSTWSAIDTFTGRALSGPLREAGVILNQVTVVTSTWGEWREAYPHTTIIAEDGGLGCRYPLNPLRGWDDGGPIFAVGDVDPRLAVHDVVVGAISPDGMPIAFPVGPAQLALEAGQQVTHAGVSVRADAGGMRVYADEQELVAHQSFWFAWSQFYPDTQLWPGPG